MKNNTYKKKILIADDTKTNIYILKEILSNEYNIIEAENGVDALRLIHRNYKNLSAVILDLIMPEMDGYEVLAKMDDNIALSQIPVIVVTSENDEQTRIRALELGANDFITKPYNPEVIRHCLHNNIKLRETASIVNAIKKDKLTGIYSREAFFEKSAEMIKDHPTGTFLLECFDIDNFKLVNEQYGATEGDRILKCIGSGLNSIMRNIGGICGRISSDNFAALYIHNNENIKKVAQVRDTEFNTNNTYINISFSIGRYIVTELNLPVSAMYDRAYIAKESVKGLYNTYPAYFNNSMLDDLISEQQIIGDMDTALKNKQFEVWLQPQINHFTKSLIGAEALVRWNHPKKGLISPGFFVPIFEQNGFIYEVDKFVWEQSCILLRRWIDEGCNPTPISVNISRSDLFREDFIDTINGYVAKYDIPIEMLRLEITESAFSKSSNQIIRIVQELTECGYTIEIDDFGSGYSSLNTLKDVPASVLKLDMYFLENNSNSGKSGSILESIVRMAKWIGMSVIAEGVETVEEANFLKSIGCNYVQGYLYAKPMPVEEYEKYSIDIPKENEMFVSEIVENTDNMSFWNPKSLDTFIFNRYTGSACILEYCNNRIEMLKVNDKYIQSLGSSVMTKDDALNIEWEKYIDKTNNINFYSLLDKAIETGKEETADIMLVKLPGCKENVYLRSTVRVIASADNRYLMYCTNNNITDQIIAQKQRENTIEQFKTIMNNMPSGISTITMQNNTPQVFFANDGFYKILGYTKEQYDKEIKSVLEVIDPKERDMVLKEIEKTNISGQSITYEHNMVCRDKRVIYAKGSLSVSHLSYMDETVILLTFNDVTQYHEKEMAYKLWKQSIYEKPKDTYTFFQFNLNKDNSIDICEGSLIDVEFSDKDMTFDDRAAAHAKNYVCVADREKYISFLNIKQLFDDYYHGKTHKVIEYRQKNKSKSLKWFRLTVELVKYSDSSDIKAYLLYENIDKQKRNELKTLKRAEIDSLTKVLNRETFIMKMDAEIAEHGEHTNHALLMLDLDCFKQVNDVFGHIIGDNALIDTAQTIKSVIGDKNFVGRLGGDEFIIFLSDIKNDSVVAETANRICEQTRVSFSGEVKISSSIGIVVCPRDGKSFKELYRKVDLALYNIKDMGKDSYVFYHEEMKNKNLLSEFEHNGDKQRSNVGRNDELQQRMLIIDDNKLDYDMLANIFKDEFIVDRASDGASGLTRLRHYGAAVSVVLLDLVMPKPDGFEVLKEMHANSKMHDIPVIVVSGDGSRESILRAIRTGATDYISKPVDAELLRIRVQAAVSKAENSRLRLQNKHLKMQRNEIEKYRIVIDRMDVAVIECNWITGTFIYDTTVSAHLAGIYDNRTLWRIFLSDMVTDTKTVMEMQDFLHNMANDRECSEKSLILRLKTPSKVQHWFKMTAYKISNEFNLTDKFILIFADLGDERTYDYQQRQDEI